LNHEVKSVVAGGGNAEDLNSNGLEDKTQEEVYQKNAESDGSDIGTNSGSIIEGALDHNKYQISATELSYLENEVLKLSNVTPRKIRILYYRYLLCKSLLSRQCESKLLRPNNLKCFVELVYRCSVKRDRIEELFELNLNNQGRTFMSEDNRTIIILSESEFVNLKRAMDFVCAY
jgi:hypothetical protein